MSLFVGRGPELEALRARLAESMAGKPQVVHIEGPAGIGKTALIEQFLGGLDPAPVVVRSSGEDTESRLAYGVVEQLARSAGEAGASLLESMPGAASPVEDPVRVGTRLLDLVDRLGSGPPVVVVVVDDVHWADLPSVQALVFALRRLVADPVLTLLAVRDDSVAGLPESLRRLVTGHRGSVLPLRGLDAADLRALAAGMGIGEFAARAAERLCDGTQGNPLHARALLEEFPPARWGPAEQPLPPPRSFRMLVRDRYEDCGASARLLVDAAAVLGPHSTLARVAALAGVEQPLAAVDEAAKVGIVRLSSSSPPWTVSFPHPLVRAAVYDELGPARRHDLHLAAAGLADDEAAALRHRVAAATDPDARLADDLTRFADGEAHRQAWQSAAAHLIDASRLVPDPAEARIRILRAVVWTLLRGDATTAATFGPEIAAFPPGPLRDAVLGGLAIAADDLSSAEQLLASAWASRRRGSDADHEVDAVVAVMTAIHSYGRLDAAATVVWCRRALDVLPPDDTALRAVAQTYLLHGLGYGGYAAESSAESASADEQPLDRDHLWLNPRSARGVLRLVDDDLDGARADLVSVAAVASERGILNTAAFGLAYLARAEWVAGDWDEALVHAERAVAINMESDFGFMRAAVVGIAALVPAARGDWDAAEGFLAGVVARPDGYERSTVALAMARARIGEACADPAAVLSALEPVRRFAHRDAVDEPGFWTWQDLYSDALVAVGRAEEADGFLVPHEELARLRGRRSALGRLARARGRIEAALGRPEQAEAAFERAVAAVEGRGLPFEQARIELAAGQFLRRAGKRRRAADLLTAAQRRFTGLGARPFAERCEAELAASGLRPATGPDRDRAGLTSQELVVARLAAGGRSNREVADELVVSIKTVEYHLRNAFQKLGVSSRRQLPDRLAALEA
ncbi:LuxR family transcriptional regulator [Pseudonocardia broussonetiae]|uniref:AAA family ATPase n=1 Tax=Pseudonocardia broussonetiae TaxID=2736640 RepID=A0A6M6JRK8_9PSEU|nr:LuxR family transcriptional regulator [Pseudonocardia broussonetiae]QJY48911.1 AAA family ATPase [Pseudonocardia broussonetiae]